MQSKPTASTILYINFDGYHLTKSAYPILVGEWNLFTQNGVQRVPNSNLPPEYTDILDPNDPIITNFFKQLDDLYVPPLNLYQQYSNQDLKDIWEYVSYGLEIFDINVTTDRSVYENAGGKKYMTIVSFKPDPIFIKNPAFWGETFGLPDKGISWKRFLCGGHRYSMGGQSYTTRPEPIPINFVFDSSSVIQYRVNQEGLTELIFQDWFSKYIFSKEAIAHNIIHEFGHLSFKHGVLNHDGQGSQDYYIGHNGWYPIMGIRQEIFQKSIVQGGAQGQQTSFQFENISSKNKISQWSKGEYQNATQAGVDDIEILGKRYQWTKAPYNKKNPTYKKCYDEKRKARSIIYSDFHENTDTVHSYLSENTKTIEGMIGYSYDFDILKIILKKGKYKFEITTANQSHFDPKVEVLRCSCERKSGSSITCSKVGENFPKDINDNFLCINYLDCDPKSSNRNVLYPGYRNYRNDDERTYFVRIDLEYTTLLYLKISGNKKPESEPPDGVKGYTSYGSVGKYFLEIKKELSDATEEDFACTVIPPAARCERYNLCGKEIFLLVQDSNMSQNTGNENEAHTIQQSIVINGKLSPQQRKFLVYAPAIDIGAEEQEGKFYLPALIDGTFQKQEFIVSKDVVNLNYDPTNGSL